MVNLGKRMRRLKPLLSIRSGPGAALLPNPSPSSPQPQLTHIHLRFPCGRFDTAVHGARLFWRTHLRRLKYHNPALPISVEHGRGHLGSPMDITLTFEGTDAEALRAIAKKSESPGAWAQKKRGLGQVRELTKEGWLTEQEKEELARKQSPNWREAPREGMKKELTDDENSDMEREKQDGGALAERPAKRTADDDAVVLKELPAEADAMDGSNPPALIYTRSVTLGVKNRTASQIWNWFKMRTNCVEVPRSVEDETEFRKLAGMFSRSAIDRERVKKGVDERKANDEMLRRARGEVEKLRAEA